MSNYMTNKLSNTNFNKLNVYEDVVYSFISMAENIDMNTLKNFSNSLKHIINNGSELLKSEYVALEKFYSKYSSEINIKDVKILDKLKKVLQKIRVVLDLNKNMLDISFIFDVQKQEIKQESSLNCYKNKIYLQRNGIYQIVVEYNTENNTNEDEITLSLFNEEILLNKINDSLTLGDSSYKKKIYYVELEKTTEQRVLYLVLETLNTISNIFVSIKEKL